jgi:hypothetical protein
VPAWGGKKSNNFAGGKNKNFAKAHLNRKTLGVVVNT